MSPYNCKNWGTGQQVTPWWTERGCRLSFTAGAQQKLCISYFLYIVVLVQIRFTSAHMYNASYKWCRVNAPALCHTWRMWSFWVTHVPALSTATERTAPWWQSIFTRASFWLGDQSVTVPLWWPKWMMALWGFWHITSSRPVLVQIAATSFPTETSRNCRKLVALWRQE